MKKLMCLCAVLISVSSFAQKPLVIQAESSQRVCVKESVFKKEVAELCVTKGNFSHDKYDFLINGENIVSAIDDETTFGVKRDWNKREIHLLCEPVNVKSGVTEEQITQMIPSFSKQKAESIAALLKDDGSSNKGLHHMLGIEIARNCSISSLNDKLMNVQVLF